MENRKEPSKMMRPMLTQHKVSSEHGSINPSRPTHKGMDFAAPKGAPVLAAHDGYVVDMLGSCVEGNINCGGGYGNYVRIIGHDGFITHYAHLNSVHVAKNAPVKMGQIIGTCGNTGHSFGNHLHFEVSEKNTYKFEDTRNPREFLVIPPQIVE